MVLISEIEEEEEVKPVPVESGFRRMQIIEASDSDDDEVGKDSAGMKDPFPDIAIEASIAGVAKAKEQGNALFAKGSIEESERCFSKGIWLAEESGRVAGVTTDVLSALYSNRAFARMRLKCWPGVEKDCCDALRLNATNAKALYRRALARLELGRPAEALEDVDLVLPRLTPSSNQEALELKSRIQKCLEVREDKDTDSKAKPGAPLESGFRRMQIVEVSDSDEEAAVVPPTTSSEAKAPPDSEGSGFRRMQIVEADDSDEESSDPFSDISIEASVAGVTKAKEQGNALFAKGSLEESERWFSKALWLAEESGRVAGVPADLRSTLHSNRAFARMRLKQWPGVETDCSEALALNATNAKALYRRALARLELGRPAEALEDIETVLPQLTPSSNPEALELKGRILESLGRGSSDYKAPSANALPLSSGPPLQSGFRRMEIVEASDDSDQEIDDPASAKSQPPSPSVNVEKASAKSQPPSPSAKVEKAPAADDANKAKPEAPPQSSFRRMQVVEASDSEEEIDKPTPSASSRAVQVANGSGTQQDPFPDISVEASIAGVTKAKEQGNALFGKGSLEEAERWFSKAIWLAEESGRVAGVPADLLSTLHSNRAFARMRLKQWPGVETDCSEALALNATNAKALYRRALARFELGRPAEALADVDKVLPQLATSSNPEALELKKRILECLDSGSADKASTSQLPSPSAKVEKASTAEFFSIASPQKEVADASPVSQRKPAPVAAPLVTNPVADQAPVSPTSPVSKRKPVPVRTLAAPTLPTASPKNSFELLRQYSSLKRHPDLLAKYVRERVPPSLLHSLFSKTPIEADDLATTLEAVRTSAREEGPAALSPEQVGEYLRQLNRTLAADTQFSMLSSSEKATLRDLMELLPPTSTAADELKRSFRPLLGA